MAEVGHWRSNQFSLFFRMFDLLWLKVYPHQSPKIEACGLPSGKLFRQVKINGSSITVNCVHVCDFGWRHVCRLGLISSARPSRDRSRRSKKRLCSFCTYLYDFCTISTFWHDAVAAAGMFSCNLSCLRRPVTQIHHVAHLSQSKVFKKY